MSKTYLKFLKPLSFLPAIGIMYLIYSLSGQNSTQSAQLSLGISTQIVEITAKIFRQTPSAEDLLQYSGLIHNFIRKCAHFGLYYVLALSVLFPLYCYGLRGISLRLGTFLTCTLYACSDEFHQSLVAGRGPGVGDVLLDSFGVFCGILTVHLFHKFLKHRQ